MPPKYTKPEAIDTKPLKIAFVHSFYREESSGENLAVIDQANMLAEDGHQISVIAARTSERDLLPTSLTRTGLRVLSGFGQNPISELNHLKPDVVHVHNLFPNFGTRWLSKAKFPIVTTLHNVRTLCAAGNFFRNGSFCNNCLGGSSLSALRHRCYHNSALQTLPLTVVTACPEKNPQLSRPEKVIFLTEKSRLIFEERFPGFFEGRAEVIPNFSRELAYIPELPRIADNKRQGWVFAGLVSSSKGILNLIANWPPDEQLEVFGEGPDFIEAQKQSYGKRIVFRGHRPRSEVSHAMTRAEGLIFPSIGMEQSPLVISEALSAGLPVITHRRSTIADELIKFGAGAIFEEFSEICNSLSQVRNDRDSLNRAARHMWNVKFNPESWKSSISATYSAAIDRFKFPG